MEKSWLDIALDGAEQELRELDQKLADFRPLMERRNHLVATLDHLRSLAPEAGSESGPPGTGEANGLVTWQRARQILGSLGRPISVPHLTRRLLANGWSGGKNPSETLRAALLRREDIFDRVGPGLFALKEWPDDVKADVSRARIEAGMADGHQEMVNFRVMKKS